MATYNDKNRVVVIHTLLSSEQLTLDDSPGNRAGSMAIADFKAGRDIVAKLDSAGGAPAAVMNIPYHSIQYLEVTEVSGETAKDPYGCSIIVSFVTNDAGQGGPFPPVEANADGQITLPGGDEQRKPAFYEDEELSTEVGVGGDVITVTESKTLYYTYPMG